MLTSMMPSWRSGGRAWGEVADGAEAGVVDEDVDRDALGDGALGATAAAPADR
jgi:hypothetical protein